MFTFLVSFFNMFLGRLRRPLDLPAIQRDIEYIAPRPVRVDAVEDALRRVDAEHAQVTEAHATAQRDVDDNVQAQHGRVAREESRRSYIGLAGLLVASDIPIQFGLVAVTMSSLHWVVQLLIAVAFALGLGALTHALAHAATADPIRPEAAAHRCRRAFYYVFTLAAVAGTLVLATRTASVAWLAILLPYSAASLWILGETMPIAAGFISAAAHHLSYDHLHNARVARLAERLDALTNFRDWLLAEQARLQQIAPASPKPATPPLHAVLPLVLLAALLFGAATTSLAQSTTTPATPAQAHNLGGVCDARFDITSSVASSSLLDALGRFRGIALPLLQASGCKLLRLGFFAEEGPFAKFEEWTVPSTPQLPDCSQAQPGALAGAAKLFSSLDNVKNLIGDAGQQVCRDEENAAIKDFTSKRAEFLISVESWLAHPPELRNTCTGIYRLLRHLRGLPVPPSELWIFTDGTETCDTEMSDLPSVPEQRVTMILLASDDVPGVAFQKAESAMNKWRHLIPGVVIVPHTELRQLLNGRDR